MSVENEERRPRVDKITGEFFRKGKCAVCKGSTERTRTFQATTMAELNRKGEEWGKDPLVHKRCEYALPASEAVETADLTGDAL